MVIYVFSGIFIIFLLDAFVSLGKCVGNGGFGGSLSLKGNIKNFPDVRDYIPRRPGICLEVGCWFCSKSFLLSLISFKPVL